MFIFDNFVRRDIEVGSDFVNLFLLKFTFERAVISPMVEGTEPVNEFPTIDKLTSEVKYPILEGSPPDILLADKLNNVIARKPAILLGIVPVSP